MLDQISRIVHYAPRGINYATRVINYGPREHLWYWLHLQSSAMIIIYNHKTFTVQATEKLIDF